jgi:hypothetical protein
VWSRNLLVLLASNSGTVDCKLSLKNTLEETIYGWTSWTVSAPLIKVMITSTPFHDDQRIKALTSIWRQLGLPLEGTDAN